MNKTDYENMCRKAADAAKKNISIPSDLINPELDHIVSIKFGFTHNIPWQVISKPENFVWVDRKTNRSKGESLTEDGKKLLAQWYEIGDIETPIGQLIESSISEYSFNQLYETLKHNDVAYIHDLPLDIACSIAPVWCQRNEELRWEKAKRAMGHTYLPTHREMQFVVYPDGTIQRVNGNTRAFMFKNNIQFSYYAVPKTIRATFYKLSSTEEAELIYHSIDSTLTAETFAEKLSGYIRHKGYTTRLPTKWQKGEGVYHIAVPALEGYIPKGESNSVTLDNISNEVERARATAERMDYFIEEMVIIGNWISRQNIPKILTAPLVGTFIKLLMRSKDNKTIIGAKTFFEHVTNNNHTQWARFSTVTLPELRNLFIMLDELQTPEDHGNQINPHVKYFNVSSRRILNELATKTSNIQDRRLYCGWIIYCFDKFISGEIMDEDIIYDVVGEKITAETTMIDFERIRQRAQSIIMSKYDNFWKNGLPTTSK
jgi:hypothetical protein